MITRRMRPAIALVVACAVSACAVPGSPGDALPSAVAVTYPARTPISTAPPPTSEPTPAITVPPLSSQSAGTSEPSIPTSPGAPRTAASASTGSTPTRSKTSRPSRPAGPAKPTRPAKPVPALYRHPVGWISTDRVVSLTFDDGPGIYTGRVLDILQRYGIKATFCQIGRQVGEFPDTERRIVAAGHTVCNHTWDHDEHLPSKSGTVMDSEISRTQQAIRTATGVTPGWYRAPGGRWGSDGRLPVELAKFGTRPLGWGVDSQDWKTPGVRKIVSTVLSTVTPGAVILMHDAGGNRSQTLAALPGIIEGLHSMGYSLVRMPPRP